jgi:hypothetical protein
MSISHSEKDRSFFQMLESDLYSMQEQIFRKKFRGAKLFPEKLYGRTD